MNSFFKIFNNFTSFFFFKSDFYAGGESSIFKSGGHIFIKKNSSFKIASSINSKCLRIVIKKDSKLHKSK